ncbi:thiamine biosynthesis protein ThiF, partial [Streptococcus pyogenes]
QYSGVFVNLEAGRTSPLPVDPEAWARFGYVPSMRKAQKPPRIAA